MARDPHDQLASVFVHWWRRLNDATADGERGESADRADAARLRRVGTIETPSGPDVDLGMALTVDSFRHLYLRVRPIMAGRHRWRENLVVAAVTLAHVRKEAGGRAAAAMLGGAAGAERPLMAEQRFLRLMRTRTSAELLGEGRRLAAILKDGAPVGDVAASLTLWLDDPNRRRVWASAYYGLNTPSPAAEPSNSTQSGMEVSQL